MEGPFAVVFFPSKLLFDPRGRERESLRLFVQNCRLIETIFVIGTGKEKQGRHPSTETKITVLTSLKKNLCKFYSLFF